ncbi:MAG: hypothetical protein AW11_00732 [Candidatus Accumulibacter regalis]|uniref:Rad50/SbcC-type AAA domain-containing protein n=1 Tax=Accumulibacter regalis TaxID=522306 RepID=A0A011P6D3_ACCRE|nr:hypothetical protein [Accumulibacter sp.]EXI90538.1 MAG: hypothetical protein AW11_00732 [Candidatus Accumulibacter regalis]HRE72640.1 hypothetical protein [Accumulibacter sp.]
MRDTGFKLTELRLRGTKVSNARIRFDPNLTIVAGLSNTGKSYIYQCIKYMLGSHTRPKDVIQAKGYSSIQLELTSQGEGALVFERSLAKASDFQLYRAPLTDIDHVCSPALLSDTHSQDDPENISSFLLRLSGFGNSLRLLEKTTTNETRPLWFHDIRPFFLVDEVRIISEQSPIRPSGQYTKMTVETAAFDLMLSGQDWSGVVPKPKKLEVRAASWAARSELLHELIAPLEKSVADSPHAAELKEAQMRSEAIIATAMRELAKVGEEVTVLNGRKKTLLDEKRPTELRIRVIEQLLGQFGLLAESYRSDLERLEFIEETANFTAQLGGESCPTCGQPLPQSEREGHPHLSGEDQIQAARAERRKLIRHLDDLATTIETLKTEQKHLADQIRSLEQQEGELDVMLKAAWHQRSKPLEKALSAEKASFEKISLQLNDWRQLEELKTKLGELGAKPRAQRKGEKTADSEPRIPTQERRKFCDILESTLRTWQVPDAGTVEFDSDMNLIVAGVQARSNGKGVRAIIKSAFAISLMRYCITADLPHPGVVVLDSPLTSYKEQDREELGEEVQEAFYSDIARDTGRGQVIILENKEPSAAIRRLTQYYYFTRSREHGRYGFFPTD